MEFEKGRGMNNIGQLKSLIFLLVAVSGVPLFVQGRCMAEVSILQFFPTDDAFVDNSVSNQNFGNETDLYIGDRPEGGMCRSYLKFNINAIPEGATIVDSQLVLEINGSGGESEDCYISAHNVTDSSWSEDSIKWNNAPEFDPIPTFDVYFLCGSAYSFAWTVTPDVVLAYNELDSSGLYSTMLKLKDELTDIYVMANSNNSELDKPYLEVTYEPIPEPAMIILLGFGTLLLRRI